MSVVISIRFRARAIFPGRLLPNASLAQPARGRAEIPSQALFNPRLLYYNVGNVMRLDLYRGTTRDNSKLFSTEIPSQSLFHLSWKFYVIRLVPSNKREQTNFFVPKLYLSLSSI